MRSLYITFIELKSGDGISKKVQAQYRAFVKVGMEMELTYFEWRRGEKYYRIGDEQLHLGGRYIAKLCGGKKFKTLLDYIKGNRVEFVYIRYTCNASPQYLDFLQRVKALGVTIYLEIPTYPYDGELKPSNLYQRCRIKLEQLFRQSLHRVVDRVVTFSNDSKIFGIECVNISNAIDFDSIKPREAKIQHDYVKFVAVATLDFWHGYDRMIKAVGRYYAATERREKIYMDVVGDGSALEELKQLAKELGVEKYVIFHGKLEGEDLDRIFQDADIGVGSLGRHRSGIYEMKALKNVEYAARGIPFIYSEINLDFDGKPYTYKITADEEPIDIGHIVANVGYRECDAQAIRSSVEHLSWESQVAKVSATLQR